VMTVLGDADPIPMARHLRGPVVTIDKVDDDDDELGTTTLLAKFLFVWPPRKDVGWKAKTLPVLAMRNAADESFIL
jgi:hypothetical protein